MAGLGALILAQIAQVDLREKLRLLLRYDYVIAVIMAEYRKRWSGWKSSRPGYKGVSMPMRICYWVKGGNKDLRCSPPASTGNAVDGNMGFWNAIQPSKQELWWTAQASTQEEALMR
ncbi:hypothetical protein ABBQ38_013750 [Trebouxia sp. C0009 RCD-2024]